MRSISPRIVRQLTAADGYLELGMPSHALNELGAIGDAGPLTPAVDFMTGLALKDQGRYDAAIVALQRAAIEIPVPHNRDVWLSLGECYRAAGSPELAVIADLFAEDSGLPPGWDGEAEVIVDDDVDSDLNAEAILALHRHSLGAPSTDYPL